MTSAWQQQVLEKYYNRRAGGTTCFRALLSEFIPQNADILELGAGPPNRISAALASLGSVTGLDVDAAVHTNSYCQCTLLYDGVTFPFDDNTFDAVVSNFVCEHIENPTAVCREVSRILKPNGVYIFRTPNLWHYVSLISRISPHWFHGLVANRIRNLPPDSHAPYPTRHRMNTRRACIRILGATGFQIEHLRVIESQPSYGMASRVLFYPMMIWERLLNAWQGFECLRSAILCAARVKK